MPVSSAMAMPMPSQITAFVVILKSRPAPPVAMTVALATQAPSSPVMRSRTTAPQQRPASWISAMASTRSSTGMASAIARSLTVNSIAWPVPSLT